MEGKRAKLSDVDLRCFYIGWGEREGRVGLLDFSEYRRLRGGADFDDLMTVKHGERRLVAGGGEKPKGLADSGKLVNFKFLKS